MKTPEQKENEPAMSLMSPREKRMEADKAMDRAEAKEIDRLNENREYRMGGKNTTASERRQMRKERR